MESKKASAAQKKKAARSAKEKKRRRHIKRLGVQPFDARKGWSLSAESEIRSQQLQKFLHQGHQTDRKHKGKAKTTKPTSNNKSQAEQAKSPKEQE